MKTCLCAVLLTLTMSATVLAERYFAVVTGVDADKGTVTFTITFGKERQTQVTAKVAKDCVIKEGYYRLGKPATTKEDADIVNGLRNEIFQKATAEKSLPVNIYTAEADDQDKGFRRGEVIKILVNPPRKK